MTILKILVSIIAFPFQVLFYTIDYIANHEARELERGLAKRAHYDAHPEIYNWKRVVLLSVIGIVCFIIAVAII